MISFVIGRLSLLSVFVSKSDEALREVGVDAGDGRYHGQLHRLVLLEHLLGGDLLQPLQAALPDHLAGGLPSQTQPGQT